MDINCTYNCIHQNEGKCGFINNPDNLILNTASANFKASVDAGCPYYYEKERHTAGFSLE